MSNLYHKGRSLKAHFRKWREHEEKAREHAKSAATILQEGVETLNQYRYDRWLRKYEIDPGAANDLLTRHRFGWFGNSKPGVRKGQYRRP